MDTRPSWLQNDKIKECFDSLPKVAQETILQSSATFNSAEELMKFSENFTGRAGKI